MGASIWGGGGTVSPITPPVHSLVGDLITLTGSIVPYTILLGYWYVGDGGGGGFYWDGSSTEDVDGWRVFADSHGTGSPGRYIRDCDEQDVIDVRYAGCVEGRTTNQNSDATLVAITGAQTRNAIKGPGFVGTVKCSGIYSLDPTRFNYTNHNHINYGVIVNGQNLGGQFIRFELGGVPTFTTPFYVPFGWKVLGICGSNGGFAQMGYATAIGGDIWPTQGNNELKDLAIFGQLRFDWIDGSGQVAYVNMENVSAVVPDNTRPALRMGDALEVYGKNCTFTMQGNTPGHAIEIVSNLVGVGIVEFENLTLSGGDILLDGSGAFPIGAMTFDNVISENIKSPFLFTIKSNTAQNTGFVLKDVVIADPTDLTAQILRIDGTAVGSIDCIHCVPGNDPSLKVISELSWNQLTVQDETSVGDLSIWRPKHKFVSGNATANLHSSIGHNCGPGYVKGTYTPIAAPIAAGFATIGGAGFDGKSNGYTQAVTIGQTPYLIQQDLPLPALIAGDVIVVGTWVKRLEQLQPIPVLFMSLLVGGTAQVDAFTGLTSIANGALLTRVSGFSWYYIYQAFKVSSGITPTLRAYLNNQQANGILTVSDPYVIIANGNLTRWEVEELAMVNLRFPSRSSAASGSQPCYFSWPSVPHMFADDVGIDPTVAGQLGIFGHLKMQDAKDVIGNTGTGTKFGTAANQKFSDWGAAPNVQPTTAIVAAAFVANASGIANDTATFGGYTLGQIVAALKRRGTLA